jgi:hypothetical protein
MKKVIFGALCFMALNLKAQTIDTTFKAMTACKIVPFKAKYTDTALSNHLGVRIISDDLKSTCTLYWALFADNVITVDGNATITGDDYAAWNGNNLYPFTFVGKLYNIIFK